jgi:hypothetical protein
MSLVYIFPDNGFVNDVITGPHGLFTVIWVFIYFVIIVLVEKSIEKHKVNKSNDTKL